MKEYFINNKIITMLFLIEIYRIVFSDIDDYETFFFFWGFIALFLFIINVLNININVGSSLGGFDAVKNHVNTEVAASEILHGKKSEVEKRGGLFKMSNWMYFMFFILNALGYMIIISG